MRGRRYWSATGRSGGERSGRRRRFCVQISTDRERSARRNARSSGAGPRIGLVTAGAGPRRRGPALGPPHVEAAVPGDLGDLEAAVAVPVADAGRADAPAAGELGPAAGRGSRRRRRRRPGTGRCRRPSRCRRRRRGRRWRGPRRRRGRRWPAASPSRGRRVAPSHALSWSSFGSWRSGASRSMSRVRPGGVGRDVVRAVAGERADARAAEADGRRRRGRSRCGSGPTGRRPRGPARRPRAAAGRPAAVEP